MKGHTTMRKWLMIGVALFLCIQPALAQDTAPTGDEIAAMFDYDASAPLEILEDDVEDRDGIAVHDIEFASPIPDTDPVSAFLVVPPGEGPFAGVLFVHWLGES